MMWNLSPDKWNLRREHTEKRYRAIMGKNVYEGKEMDFEALEVYGFWRNIYKEPFYSPLFFSVFNWICDKIAKK